MSPRADGSPAPEDAHDLLNAYLDGELDAAERATVDRALAGSAALRRDLAELQATQTMLRALPLVEPVGVPAPSVAIGEITPITPSPIEPSDHAGAVAVVLLDRHRRRAVTASVGAIAAAMLILVGVGAILGPMPIAPSVDEFASTHMGTAGAMGGFDDMDADTMDDPAVLAGLGDGMDRMGVFARDDLVRTVYSDGNHEVSVFHEPGVVDWEALPVDGVMRIDGTTKTWTGVRDETVVAVAERGDLMVVIVADADMGADEAEAKAMEAVEMVPPVSVERGLWDRIGDAPANLVDRI